MFDFFCTYNLLAEAKVGECYKITHRLMGENRFSPRSDIVGPNNRAFCKLIMSRHSRSGECQILLIFLVPKFYNLHTIRRKIVRWHWILYQIRELTIVQGDIKGLSRTPRMSDILNLQNARLFGPTMSERENTPKKVLPHEHIRFIKE